MQKSLREYLPAMPCVRCVKILEKRCFANYIQVAGVWVLVVQKLRAVIREVSPLPVYPLYMVIAYHNYVFADPNPII
jgi:hypothetical protein